MERRSLLLTNVPVAKIVQVNYFYDHSLPGVPEVQYVTIRPARLFFNYEPPSETIYFPLLSSFPFNRPLYVHITRTILTRSS